MFIVHDAAGNRCCVTCSEKIANEFYDALVRRDGRASIFKRIR